MEQQSTMARAQANVSEAYEHHFYTQDQAEDSDEDDQGIFKQNGGVHTDRYGFVGGDQYTDPNTESRIPVAILRRREVKWLDMLENWEKWMTKRFKKVKERCRKGIPPSIRPRAWQYLCGSKYMVEHNCGRYEEYLSQSGDPRWVDDISKDLHRQFPFHEMFARREGHGQEDLFCVLKAYSIHNPRDGYCQAQAPIAAVLLMHMPAEQAFWCLVSICDKYLPDYYSTGLEAVQTDGDVLFGLLKKCSPITYKHLKKQKIEPILYMTEWFMCVFTRTLPWASVLRVWDIFFCEGVKVMFRVALVLFKFSLGRSDQLSQCPSLYETMERIRHIPAEYMEEDFLSRECTRLPITERDMEKEHQFQISRRKTLKEQKNKTDMAKKPKKKSKTSSSPDYS